MEKRGFLCRNERFLCHSQQQMVLVVVSAVLLCHLCFAGNTSPGNLLKASFYFKVKTAKFYEPAKFPDSGQSRKECPPAGGNDDASNDVVRNNAEKKNCAIWSTLSRLMMSP